MTVSLFPISRSKAHVARLADALDAQPDEAAMQPVWRATAREYGRQLLNRGVPREEVNAEVANLLDAAVHIVAARRAARQRTVARRAKLSLVQPAQLDLFTNPHAPAQPAAPRATFMDNDHVA